MALMGLPMKIETPTSVQSAAAPFRQASLLHRYVPPAPLAAGPAARVPTQNANFSHRAVSTTAAEDIRQPQYEAFVWGDQNAPPVQQLAPCRSHTYGSILLEYEHSCHAPSCSKA